MSTLDNMKEFSFAQQADNFDEHISTAIPWYNTLDYMVLKIAEYFCLENTNIFDLGCSTGRVITKLSENNKWNFTGVDIEKEFFKNYKTTENLSFLNKNIIDLDFTNSSLIISMFTIQFLNYWDIKTLFKNIHNWLINWWWFVFSMKVYSNTWFFQNIKTSVYWEQRLEKDDFKIEEQFNKDIALRKQMRLYSEKEVFKILDELWFTYETIWKNYNFVWIICRKI